MPCKAHFYFPDSLVHSVRYSHKISAVCLKGSDPLYFSLEAKARARNNGHLSYTICGSCGSSSLNGNIKLSESDIGGDYAISSSYKSELLNRIPYDISNAEYDIRAYAIEDMVGNYSPERIIVHELFHAIDAQYNFLIGQRHHIINPKTNEFMRKYFNEIERDAKDGGF